MHRPIPCPLCRRGNVVAGRISWGCTRRDAGCALLVSFRQYGRTLSAATGEDLLRRGNTDVMDDWMDAGGDYKRGRLLFDAGAPGMVRFEEVER